MVLKIAEDSEGGTDDPSTGMRVVVERRCVVSAKDDAIPWKMMLVLDLVKSSGEVTLGDMDHAEGKLDATIHGELVVMILSDVPWNTFIVEISDPPSRVVFMREKLDKGRDFEYSTVSVDVPTMLE